MAGVMGVELVHAVGWGRWAGTGRGGWDRWCWVGTGNCGSPVVSVDTRARRATLGTVQPRNRPHNDHPVHKVDLTPPARGRPTDRVLRARGRGRARCVGGRPAMSSSAGGPGSARLETAPGARGSELPGPRPRLVEALGQRRPAPVVQARPRTGSGDLGHGTACPRPPDGVPGPGGPVPVPPPARRTRPVTALARRCRPVGSGRSQPGSADGGWGVQLDRRCPPRSRPGRPGRPGPGVNALARPTPWTDTS